MMMKSLVQTLAGLVLILILKNGCIFMNQHSEFIAVPGKNNCPVMQRDIIDENN